FNNPADATSPSESELAIIGLKKEINEVELFLTKTFRPLNDGKDCNDRDYIKDEEEISRNKENIDAYEESSNSSCQTMILEDIVNLRDPVFQDREVTQFEFLPMFADTNTNIEDGVSMYFNPETVLSVELEIQ
ncbi:22597_t:CDS:2, partial [Gigaspora rosea]